MKTTMLVLTILAASLTAFAEKPQPAPSLQAELVKQQKAQVSKPIFVPLRLTQPAPKQKIEHVDGMSSRPWMLRVGLHPGWPAIPRPERHEATWRILQVKF
jgi:hypothetical protein